MLPAVLAALVARRYRLSVRTSLASRCNPDMTLAHEDSADPPAVAPSVATPPAAGPDAAADTVGDFIGGWLTSRSAAGTHDADLVALVGAHRKKDSIAEPALLKGLVLYAQQIAANSQIAPMPPASSTAPESAT